MSVLLDIGGKTVRPTRLGDAALGTTFLLPSHDGYLVGTLLKVTPGYAKVAVVGEEEVGYVPDKKKGGLREIHGRSTYETEWSRGTMVYPVPVEEEVTVVDSVPVELDPKGQPKPPKPLILAPNRKVPGGAVLKPSNAVKEEKTIPVTKESIMAKVEKANEKAAAKGAKALAPKAPKAPKPMNICPVTGEQVKRRFKPGMDARYYGWLKKIVRGQMTTKELPEVTRKHLSKIDTSLARAIEKELTDHGVDVAALKEEAAG